MTFTKQEYSSQFPFLTTSGGEPIVHTVESEHCAVDDDHERHLLGFLGKYL